MWCFPYDRDIQIVAALWFPVYSQSYNTVSRSCPECLPSSRLFTPPLLLPVPLLRQLLLLSDPDVRTHFLQSRILSGQVIPNIFCHRIYL